MKYVRVIVGLRPVEFAQLFKEQALTIARPQDEAQDLAAQLRALAASVAELQQLGASAAHKRR